MNEDNGGKYPMSNHHPNCEMESFSFLNARVDSIYYLGASIIDYDNYNDYLIEFLSDMSEDELSKLFDVEIPDDYEIYESECEMIDFLASKNLRGFIVVVSAIHKDYMTWGVSTSRNFYADTLEDAINKGIDWATEYNKQRKE